MDYVAYYRVSTRRQEASGLGLDAQSAAVFTHLNGEEPVRSFTDVESGKNNARPQLSESIEYCKRTGATLIIAKLDRLSRNMAFISALMESKVKFLACDQPHADEFTIHILAAVAQKERQMISTRITEALRAAKARGTKLGNPKADKSHMERMRAARKPKEIDPQTLALIRGFKKSGQTYRQIADSLNQMGLKTARNCNYSAGLVHRILNRRIQPN